MELIENYHNVNNTYSKKIRKTKYTEGEKVIIDIKGINDICELIISKNEIQYDNIQETHRNSFTINKKLEIAEGVKKNVDYSRKFTVSLIQNGFQEINYLSSILYLNEFYKIHCIIYNNDTKKFYHTSFKNYPKLICVYKNNGWFIDNQNIDVKESSDISELSNILTIDCDIMIFKPFLESISKWKIKQLEELCNSRGIQLNKSNGKKKIKKELYDEINLYEINKN